MAEILTKESETGELEIFTSGAPTTLSADQIENYTKIIRDNSPYLQDQIKELKTRYPEVLGDVSPMTDSEISELSEIDASKLASRLSNYQKIALDDVTSISSTTGFTVIAADPNSARFAERTDTALKNYFKIASEVNNFNLDLPTELSKLSKMVSNFSKTFIGKISDDNFGKNMKPLIIDEITGLKKRVYCVEDAVRLEATNFWNRIDDALADLHRMSLHTDDRSLDNRWELRNRVKPKVWENEMWSRDNQSRIDDLEEHHKICFFSIVSKNYLSFLILTYRFFQDEIVFRKYFLFQQNKQ